MAKKPVVSKLIEAWIDLVAVDGIAEVTLQKVAKRAEVPLATAHYHFGPEADDLAEAALGFIGQHAQEHTASALEKGRAKSKDPVRVYAQVTFEWVMRFDRYAKVWLYSYYWGALSAKSRKQQMEVLETARLRIRQLVFEAKGMGLIGAHLDVTDLTRHAHALMFGYFIQAIMIGSNEGKQRLLEDCLAGLDLLFKRD